MKGARKKKQAHCESENREKRGNGVPQNMIHGFMANFGQVLENPYVQKMIPQSKKGKLAVIFGRRQPKMLEFRKLNVLYRLYYNETEVYAVFYLKDGNTNQRELDLQEKFQSYEAATNEPGYIKLGTGKKITSRLKNKTKKLKNIVIEPRNGHEITYEDLLSQGSVEHKFVVFCDDPMVKKILLKHKIVEKKKSTPISMNFNNNGSVEREHRRAGFPLQFSTPRKFKGHQEPVHVMRREEMDRARNQGTADAPAGRSRTNRVEEQRSGGNGDLVHERRKETDCRGNGQNRPSNQQRFVWKSPRNKGDESHGSEEQVQKSQQRVSQNDSGAFFSFDGPEKNGGTEVEYHRKEGLRTFFSFDGSEQNEGTEAEYHRKEDLRALFSFDGLERNEGTEAECHREEDLGVFFSFDGLEKKEGTEAKYHRKEEESSSEKKESQRHEERRGLSEERQKQTGKSYVNWGHSKISEDKASSSGLRKCETGDSRVNWQQTPQQRPESNKLKKTEIDSEDTEDTRSFSEKRAFWSNLARKKGSDTRITKRTMHS